MKNKKQFRPVGPLLMGLSIFLLAACGEKSQRNIHKAMGSVQEGGEDNQSQVLQGNYRVRFTALNPELSENLEAHLVGEIRDDEVKVSIRGMNMAEGISHPQFLYEARSCPTMDDDTNEDGVLDQVEVLEATEGILVPFDDDLTEQISATNVFPMSSSEGSYEYEEKASLSAMLRDLRETDENFDDHYIKLSEDEELELEGKIVILHGVSATALLPQTVASEGELAVHETVPIACGVVERINGDEAPVPTPNPIPVPTPTDDQDQDQGSGGKGGYHSGKGKGLSATHQYTYQE